MKQIEFQRQVIREEYISKDQSEGQKPRKNLYINRPFFSRKNRFKNYSK